MSNEYADYNELFGKNPSMYPKLENNTYNDYVPRRSDIVGFSVDVEEDINAGNSNKYRPDVINNVDNSEKKKCCKAYFITYICLALLFSFLLACLVLQIETQSDVEEVKDFFKIDDNSKDKNGYYFDSKTWKKNDDGYRYGEKKNNDKYSDKKQSDEPSIFYVIQNVSKKEIIYVKESNALDLTNDCIFGNVSYNNCRIKYYDDYILNENEIYITSVDYRFISRWYILKTLKDFYSNNIDTCFERKDRLFILKDKCFKYQNNETLQLNDKMLYDDTLGLFLPLRMSFGLEAMNVFNMEYKTTKVLNDIYIEENIDIEKENITINDLRLGGGNGYCLLFLDYKQNISKALCFLNTINTTWCCITSLSNLDFQNDNFFESLEEKNILDNTCKICYSGESKNYSNYTIIYDQVMRESIFKINLYEVLRIDMTKINMPLESGDLYWKTHDLSYSFQRFDPNIILPILIVKSNAHSGNIKYNNNKKGIQPSPYYANGCYSMNPNQTNQLSNCIFNTYFDFKTVFEMYLKSTLFFTAY